MKSLRLALAALAVVMPLSLSAAPAPWDAAPFAGTPQEVLAAAATVSPADAELVILLDESRYQFAPDGTSTSVHRRVYRVIAQSAVEDWGTVSSIWAPWYEERPTIQARVITKDGTVHQLDAAAISEAPGPEDSLDIFSDNRVIRAPLPAVAEGSVVEQVITRKQRSPIAGAGMADAFEFGSWVPIEKARLVITKPESLAFNLENRTSPSIEPVKTSADGQQTMTWEAGPLKKIEFFEWNLPSDLSNRPYVAFSTGKSWQDLATKYNEIVERQLASSSMAAIAKEAIGSAKSRAEKIDSVLAYVQRHVRYAGVELGEGSIVPRTPDTVLQNRYGDCKDKATLVVSLLRANGIPANVVLLRAGSDLDVNPRLPGLGLFNHAIVRVSGEPGMWIDPTDEFSRAGELPVMDQGRNVLVVDPKTTQLVTTPEADGSANHVIETRVVTLKEEGKGSIVETSEPRGAQESSMRRFSATSEKKEYRESLEEYVQSYYGAKTLKNVETSDPHDLTKPFKLTVEADETVRAQTGGGEAAVAIIAPSILGDLPYGMRRWVDPEQLEGEEKTKALARERKHDFVFKPFTREWHYRIASPTGFAPRPLPENETVKLGTTTLTMRYEKTPDNTVLATVYFDSGKRRLTADELRATQKAINEFEKRGPIIIGFDQIGQLRLSEGDVSGALTEFSRLETMHPKEARHQVDYARALLVGGMGEAARREIDRALAIEPGYAQGHRMRGAILEHDLFGRPYRKGFDRKGSIASYQKARELDPKNVDFRKELANMLTVGDNGVRFTKGSDLDAAIKEYRSIIDELKDNSVEGDLVLALVRAERFKELREIAPKLEDEKRRHFARVFAAAALEGSAAAIREASTLDATERNSTLSTSGGLLLASRRYAVAADLLEAAMQGSPTTEQRARVETIRKARKFEDMKLDEKDPRTVITRLSYALVAGQMTLESFSKFFTADEQKLIASMDEDESWLAGGETILSAAREQSLPLEFYADLGLSSVQYSVEGDDTTGYRVKTRTQNQRGTDETFYVVREGDRYAVSASTKVPGLIGLSALRFLDAKQNDAARLWLNWAREEFVPRSGDDPVAGLPFTRLWSKNRSSATEDEMRTAAASLMVQKDLADRALPILEKALAAAKDDAAREPIELSLAMLHLSKKDSAKLLPIAKALTARYPDSTAAFELFVASSALAQKPADIEAAARERLVRLPKNAEAMRALGEAAMLKGDYKIAATRFEDVLGGFEPNANDYNSAAWNALFFTGADIKHALEQARQSIELSGNASAPMHTLATLYAEAGKSLEAREALMQSMDVAGRDEPASHDWYVLGRIAENYGAKEAAIDAYKRVEKPERLDASDTYILAERRLKALAAKP
jgi:tetratricopeptide (TPR) repeat protein